MLAGCGENATPQKGDANDVVDRGGMDSRSGQWLLVRNTPDDELAGAWVAFGRLGVQTPDVGRVERRDDPLPAVPATDTRVAFIAGYHDAGGRDDYLAHIVGAVIPCEYGWQPYVKVNQYESRAQFDPQSWETAGGGDPADDYTVGRNVANWIALIDDPGSTSGWPVCWWR